MQINAIKLIVIITTCIGSLIHCQNSNLIVADTIYLDENNNKLTKSDYGKIVNTKLYHTLVYEGENSTPITLKARKSFGFGKIPVNSKEQLFKILAIRNGVDTTKTMTIHYIDTLKKLKIIPKGAM